MKKDIDFEHLESEKLKLRKMLWQIELKFAFAQPTN